MASVKRETKKTAEKAKNEPYDHECFCDKGNPFVAIPASLAGIFLVIIALVLIFAEEQLGIIVPIAWAFVVLGIVALVFAYRAQQK